MERPSTFGVTPMLVPSVLLKLTVPDFDSWTRRPKVSDALVTALPLSLMAVLRTKVGCFFARPFTAADADADRSFDKALAEVAVETVPAIVSDVTIPTANAGIGLNARMAFTFLQAGT